MKSIIATTFSLLLCCAGTAGAQQALHEGHKNKLDTNANGRVSQQEYRSFMSNAFKVLDTDKNGALDPSETVNILSGSQFSVADTNEDGRVSRNEFTDQVMKDFAAADKSGDGHLQ